ncbi:RHS repeat-associated core domain-containing protein [Micromonospora chalcea]
MLSHAGALALALRAGDVGYVVGQCPTLVIVEGERGSRPGRVASPGACPSGTTRRCRPYPAQGGAPGTHPHAVTTITNSGANTTTATYTYDETGNTKTRPGPTGNQTLTWDPENHLATTQDTTGTTSYLYDADGNRLIRKDPTGATLYLPGGTEVRKPTSGAATATRYYTGPGGTIATRTSTGTLHWIASDHHGTAETTITSTDLTASRRRSHPFGTERGTTTGTWPATMDKGFVGGTKDNTGLTHLGAREYDPSLGRFISVDPIINLTDPQQWNGYAYAHHNPATSSDPSGLIDTDCLTVASCPDYRMGDEKGNREKKAKSRSCWPRCNGSKDLTKKNRRQNWSPPKFNCKRACASLLPNSGDLGASSRQNLSSAPGPQPEPQPGPPVPDPGDYDPWCEENPGKCDGWQFSHNTAWQTTEWIDSWWNIMGFNKWILGIAMGSVGCGGPCAAAGGVLGAIKERSFQYRSRERVERRWTGGRSDGRWEYRSAGKEDQMRERWAFEGNRNPLVIVTDWEEDNSYYQGS